MLHLVCLSPENNCSWRNVDRSDWDLNLCLENECRRKQVKKWAVISRFARPRQMIMNLNDRCESPPRWMPGLTSEQSIGEKTSLCESHCDILENLSCQNPFFREFYRRRPQGLAAAMKEVVFLTEKSCLPWLSSVGGGWGPFCKAPILPAIIIIIQKVGLVFEGREHSGIEDARNTARLVWLPHSCLKTLLFDAGLENGQWRLPSWADW